MSRNPAEDVLNELLPYFEALDTQNAALVQFLKDKRVVSDEQLAPYLERAAKASNVKWFGARLRMGRLFSVPETKGEGAAEKPEQDQQQTSRPGTDRAKHSEESDERGRGETAEKKSDENADLSGNKTGDHPEASERTTKSPSAEHAGSEKDVKTAPERDADDADKDAA
jgi:hypothetical protein